MNLHDSLFKENMKTITLHDVDFEIYELCDYASTTLLEHQETLKTMMDKNQPPIEFIGFTGEYKNQYTSVVYTQGLKFYISPIKKIKQKIIKSNYTYVRIRSVVDSAYITEKVKTYASTNNYSLLEVGSFQKSKTLITLTCNNNHTFTKKFELIVEGKRCPLCHGPKSLPPTARNKNIQIMCDEIGYKFNGYILENGARSILDLTCSRNHSYHPLYYNFITNKYKCGECAVYDKSSYKCREILTHIEHMGYVVKSEHTFKNCKNILPLPFDFYLPELNMCIEYDGEQHFHVIDFWGGETALEKQKINDEIKNNYCIENGIHLLRIKYDIENYIDVVENFIKGVNDE